jgi:3',5'-cyclic AMP phosphodiesterase CpdA
MSTITWLHISHLHLRPPKPPEPGPLPYDVNVVLRSFLNDVAKRIEEDGLRPDFIAVTGDVAFSGKAEEYELARRFFDDLLGVTGLGKERLFPSKCWIMPGR